MVEWNSAWLDCMEYNSFAKSLILVIFRETQKCFNFQENCILFYFLNSFQASSLCKRIMNPKPAVVVEWQAH